MSTLYDMRSAQQAEPPTSWYVLLGRLVDTLDDLCIQLACTFIAYSRLARTTSPDSRQALVRVSIVHSAFHILVQTAMHRAFFCFCHLLSVILHPLLRQPRVLRVST